MYEILLILKKKKNTGDWTYLWELTLGVKELILAFFLVLG